MKLLVQKGVDYWFYLSPKVYVVDKENIFLYHTESGARLEVTEEHVKDVLRAVHEPENLGVVEFPQELWKQEEVYDLIEQLLSLHMAGLMPIDREKGKPINFLPILNLQKDVDKAMSIGELSLVVDDLLSYLSRLTLCLGGGRLCPSYLSRAWREEENNWMSPCLLYSLLEQVRYSRLKQVSLYADFLFLHPQIKEILSLLENYEYDYQLWVSAKHYLQYRELIKTSLRSMKRICHLSLLIPATEVEDLERIKEDDPQLFSYHILIEDEEQYTWANQLIEKWGITQSEPVPIYTGDNLPFFEEYIYLCEDDIFSEPIEMRRIFCNQKLNANDFGALTVLSTGECRVSMNTPILGNLIESSLLEILYKELTTNTAWRKIRNSGKCQKCIFQYLCPPPSNYEYLIGKEDLCHLP